MMKRVAVLFGTVEYFEREIVKYLTKDKLNSIAEDRFHIIITKLKSEILYDFVCHERIRAECLDNLFFASRNLKRSGLKFSNTNVY
jgi:hypothetical protein